MSCDVCRGYSYSCPCCEPEPDEDGTHPRNCKCDECLAEYEAEMERRADAKREDEYWQFVD